MFKKNKGVISFLIICICFALTACSGNSSDSENDDITPIDNQEEQMEDFDLDVASGDEIGDSVKLPDDYPSDIFPIYKDSYIFSVVEYEESFTITAFSKDDYNAVIAFYKDLLGNTEATYEVNTSEGYTRFGTVGEFTYNLTIIISDEFEDYDSSIVIMLAPTS